MAADLAALTGEECVTLFAREWQLRDRVSASHSFEQERLDALCRMAFGRTGIVVATVDGMMQRTLPPTALRDAVLTLRLGEEHDLHALAERLTAAGYVRCEQVEGAGQFAVRGGILDVYSPMSAPVRVEFFDTEIDAMGEFDVATQRRAKHRAVYAAHAADRRRPRAEADDLLQLPQLRQRHHLPVQLLHECPLLFRRNAQKGADRPRSDGLYPHTSFSMFS